MTNTIQAIQIPLSQLILRDDVQSRVHEDESTVARYAEAMKPDEAGYAAEFPAIVVVQDGDRFIVAEGFHRTKAAMRVNPNGTIAAAISPPYKDWTPVALARYISSRSNTEEVFPRTREGKINAVMGYLLSPDDEHVDKSDTFIAKFLRVDRRHHVAIARKLLEAGYTRYAPLPDVQSGRSGHNEDSRLISSPEAVNCSTEQLSDQRSHAGVITEQHTRATALVNEGQSEATIPFDAKPVPTLPIAAPVPLHPPTTGEVAFHIPNTPDEPKTPLTGLAATLAQITAHEPAILAVQVSLETLLQQLHSPADCHTARPIVDMFTVKLQTLMTLHAQVYNVLNSSPTPS